MIQDTSMQDTPLSTRASSAARFRHRLQVTAIVSLSAIVALFAYPSIEKWQSASLTIDGERLRTAIVERGQFVRDISVQGKVVAAVRPMLFSPADGRVTTLVRSGDRVTIGHPVAAVESPELLNEYAQELSKLGELDTQLARHGIETRMAQLAQKEKVALSKMALVAAKRELRRAKIAHEQQAISLQDYEKAVDDKDRAYALSEHQEEGEQLKTERLKLEFDILNHAFTRQALVVDDLKRKIDSLQVRSPVDGIVGNLEVEQKSIVARYQPILSIVDMTVYEVEARVPETYADDLLQGMAVEMNFSGELYQGELSAVSPEVENGQVRCRIRFIGVTPEGLRQNQRVTSRILIEARDDVLMVTRGPFMQSGSRGFAYLVENDLARKTSVSIGATSVGKVEILSGLVAGQKIVISSSDVFDNHDRVMLLNR
ncbi:MAG: HlyD family secretion protein [Crocinitomicaceae bacterium]